jgi:hypothetical protein
MNVIFTWLLIDIVGIATIIATTLVLAVLHIIKFYFYRASNLFDRQLLGHVQFTIYSIIMVISFVLHITLVWFLIDIMSISTIISVTAVVVGLFILRFGLFKATHLIGTEDNKAVG